MFGVNWPYVTKYHMKFKEWMEATEGLSPGIHNLKDGGSEFYNGYRTYGYDQYIVGNTWQEAERFMGEYYKTKNLKITSFDPPVKRGKEYEDWQLGKWKGNYPDYSFRNQRV